MRWSRCDFRAWPLLSVVMTGDAADVDLLRRRVLNVVGHELRTPVTTLTGLAVELEACHDESRRVELTSAVARNARRLDGLVDDLLLAAGITTVAPVDDRQPVDLVALARGLWTGPVVDFEGAARAVGREPAVRRALREVLDNAALYGDAPYSVRAWEADGRAVIEIANAGSVLTEADLALAHELFFRGERAVTTSAGLGVGLALARTLLRTDGGEVTLRPREGGGVDARVELPAA